MPGPCDPEDLLDGVIFGAKYLGSTQLQSEKNPSTNARMAQAQEAMDRIKVKKILFILKKAVLSLIFKFCLLKQVSRQDLFLQAIVMNLK